MAHARLLTVAGEASSDAHAAGLLEALRDRGWRGECVAVGGPALAAAGARLIADQSDLAVVGLSEVCGRLPRILRLLGRVRDEIARRPPDLFLPVDTPEFNLRLLPHAARRGVPVVYFVAPQTWAWRPRRTRILRRHARELLVLFPFEEPWFRERGVAATYVGHPLVDAARAWRAQRPRRGRQTPEESGPAGLLLPGSRSGEVRRHLPVLAAAVELLRRRGLDLRWRVRAAPGLDDDFYAPWTLSAGIELRREPILELAAGSAVTVAASGTASFEAALAGSPLIVVYRVSPLTWLLARRMVRVPHVAMANLALGRGVVPELLQDDCAPARIAGEIEGLLGDPARAERMRAELAGLDARFGPSGALARAAERVQAHLEPRGG
ncbi:MAG: lipid-A-disaccharide synthase [Candidatus Eisenbacteria bacterium]|uniref:Lipid-A-disaccharide synthase n=1 Tax=Eiseniibacteriota bacterium TaxID=2212470 RepID=A0A938BN84_UNCEI|nr:lipid-A-disaccharide synthase [Candidatus Eisenbacteria bacterium]